MDVAVAGWVTAAQTRAYMQLGAAIDTAFLCRTAVACRSSISVTRAGGRDHGKVLTSGH